jgi:hypothetical protein
MFLLSAGIDPAGIDAGISSGALSKPPDASIWLESARD